MAWLLPQSSWLPGTCSLLHIQTQDHCKLAVSAWSQAVPKTSTAWMILIPSNSISDWRKGLLIQWHLTYISKTLAVGASLSIAGVCQICCPQPSTETLAVTSSVDASSQAVTLTAVGMLLQWVFPFLPALHLSSIRKTSKYRKGLWLRCLRPGRIIHALPYVIFTDTPKPETHTERGSFQSLRMILLIW